MNENSFNNGVKLLPTLVLWTLMLARLKAEMSFCFQSAEGDKFCRLKKCRIEKYCVINVGSDRRC